MKPTILVVEDDPLTVQILRRMLEKASYSVECRMDGEEGLSAARALKPALLVLDFMLPSLDGLEICRTLKEDAATSKIPVLMLSAAADEHLEADARAVGVDGFLPKPVDMRSLIDTVGLLIGAQERLG